MRKWPERYNIAFSGSLRHDSAHFWRLKVHADTRLSRRPAGRREETTVYRDKNHGMQGSKPRYRRIETTVYKQRNHGMGGRRNAYRHLPDRRVSAFQRTWSSSMAACEARNNHISVLELETLPFRFASLNCTTFPKKPEGEGRRNMV